MPSTPHEGFALGFGSSLAVLSIFKGSFTLAAATFIQARDDEAEVLELLSGLIRKSLVQVDGGGAEKRISLLDHDP